MRKELIKQGFAPDQIEWTNINKNLSENKSKS
jgi:ribosomal protein L24E